MEQRVKLKKQYQSASYVTSSAVFYGSLLFLIARFFSFIQLFADAYNRNQLNQAPPENFTFLGILGSVIVLAVIAWMFILLLRYRRRMTRLRRGNLYLLLNLLFIAWGLIQAISYFVEMVLFFEFVYLLDFITLAGALIVPSVLLQLADRRQEPAQDTALLVSAISSTALAVIAALIVSLALRKSYTTMQLVRELMFRAGIILFGIAGIQKAMKLRSEPIAYTPKTPNPAPEPKIKEPKIKESKPDKHGRIECPDCGKKLRPDVDRCPRCGFDMSTPNLFDDDDEDAPEPEEEASDFPADPEPTEEEETLIEEETPEPEPKPQKPKHIDTCPRCGKNIPPFLTTCPHCGYFPGDPLELPKEPEKQAVVPPTIPTIAAPERENICFKCGKRIPGGLSTCPYCGYHPDDGRVSEQHAVNPESEHDAENIGLFDEEILCPRCDRPVAKGTQICPHCGYPFPDESTRRIRTAAPKLPRVPDPKRLTEKNSIKCPECGRRYSAARDTCPYCGFSLYED